ncbi:MAG: hypothetical protein JSV49_07330 [Thermoplasmata archaeon]|nr:MAG: hypothetical protein JSV49_07330 [Thermoplasmata archaeon]
MGNSAILDDLSTRKITPDDLAEMVIHNIDLLPDIIKGISSDNARIRLGCAKIIRTVSEKKPDAVYPVSKYFITLLDSENNIIKWNAMDVLANLAKVDSNKTIEKIFTKYYDLLTDESMVTAGHVVDNSGKIAIAKPHLTERITDELLKLDKIPRNTECKNILKGKAILAFDAYFEQIENKDAVISFVKKQLRNKRNATKTKAKQFLKKYDT